MPVARQMGKRSIAEKHRSSFSNARRRRARVDSRSMAPTSRPAASSTPPWVLPPCRQITSAPMISAISACHSSSRIEFSTTSGDPGLWVEPEPEAEQIGDVGDQFEI